VATSWMHAHKFPQHYSSRDDGLDGVVAALFEGAEDRNQHRLAVGALPAAVAVAVLANNHRRPDRPFRRIVVESSAGLIQKRELVVLMTPQPLDQTLRMAVLPGRVDQLL